MINNNKNNLKEIGNFSSDKDKEINSYYFKNHKNEKKNKKVNLFYMDTDFLKNKGNYLYGNNNNFVGKSIKNYHTKNNVFLPNLSLRIKFKLPRYERQLDGFVLA